MQWELPDVLARSVQHFRTRLVGGAGTGRPTPAPLAECREGPFRLLSGQGSRAPSVFYTEIASFSKTALIGPGIAQTGIPGA